METCQKSYDIRTFLENRFSEYSDVKALMHDIGKVKELNCLWRSQASHKLNIHSMP